MAAPTYSIGSTGARADSPFTIASIKIPDNSGVDGSANQAMALNTQLLCKKPDGSQAWYTIDAERSLPGKIVLKAVSP